MAATELGYPFRVAHSGRTATESRLEHIRSLIEQVLFTAPGERVNRPDFGIAVRRLVFEGANEEMMAATQFLIQGELQQWLGHLIDIEAVLVENVDANLNVTIKYIVRQDQQAQIARFTR